MRIRDPGHRYELRSLDGGKPIPLWFVKREGPWYPGNVGHHPGTTMQEVFRALIDRGEYVNNQIPCAETQAVVALCRTAILLLEQRAARRHGRFLEVGDLRSPEAEAICGRCGHIRCGGHATVAL